jgi:hypothetical protein
MERSGRLLATRPVAPIVASREDAAKVLVETDAGFFGDARGVGIDGLEKALDFLLNLLTSQRDDLTWLDLAEHFRLHSTHPREI